ncbi:MAG: hypothetical protein SVP52_10100 [Chloroflexota bacterium]|nr:hypothetical protein [Chloroflexota bacterium]
MRSSEKSFWLSIISGVLLVAAGVIFLLVNLDLIKLDWEMLIGPLFGMGGLVFLIAFALNTDDWWALIPAFVLFGIGSNIFMDYMIGAAADQWAGTVFFGLLGTSFLLIYIFHSEHWWAVIPGGVLLTLAGVNLVSENNLLSGGLFFLGMASTFGSIYILPKPSGKSKWALYPAGILLLIGALATLGAVNVMNYVWPLALLMAGGYVIYRSLKK